MLHLRFESVFAFFVLCLLFGCDQTSTIKMDDDGYCGFLDAEEEVCSSYCYKSVKPTLAYIVELKDQLKAKTEEHLVRDNEIRVLREKFLDLSDYRDHVKALNRHIEELLKTNDVLRKSVQQLNLNTESGRDLKLKANEANFNERIANQNNLKREIEQERQRRIEIEEKSKLDIENLMREKNKIKEELESKLKRELKEHESKEEEFQSQVSSCEKQLKEFQQQNKEKESIPKTNCKGLSTGIQRITIPELDSISALCNADIDGGGWIVIQKRFDGSEDFYRNWTEYRNGFGDLKGEFFIGLESLHRITNSQSHELYIKMEHYNGKVEFARYNNFRVGSENEKYKLQSLGVFSGTADNPLDFDLNVKFSTYDQDNDEESKWNLAEVYHGGWWYNYHVGPNLNGRYYTRPISDAYSMHWHTFESLRSVQMLIRPNLK